MLGNGRRKTTITVHAIGIEAGGRLTGLPDRQSEERHTIARADVIAYFPLVLAKGAVSFGSLTGEIPTQVFLQGAP